MAFIEYDCKRNCAPRRERRVGPHARLTRVPTSKGVRGDGQGFA
ncbi:hypothetical protein [Lysobacter gummosus]